MTEKVLVVTGGGRGIGAAVAKLAAAQGLPCGGQFPPRQQELPMKWSRDIAGAGGMAVAIAGDVSLETDVVRLFDEAASQLGPITHVVNNAGITGRSSRLDAAEDGNF